jgi:hypothetical protein
VEIENLIAVESFDFCENSLRQSKSLSGKGSFVSMLSNYALKSEGAGADLNSILCPLSLTDTFRLLAHEKK